MGHRLLGVFYPEPKTENHASRRARREPVLASNENTFYFSSMDATTARLVAVEEIQRLKYRYLRTLDLKRWDEFADTLAPDATADYGSQVGQGPLRFTGRDAIVGYMSGAIGPDITTVHVCHHPEITVDGDTAEATWCLEDTVLATGFGTMIRGAAYYSDRYRRDDGVWRIVHTGYTRLYEAVIPFDALPGLRLTTPPHAG